MELPMDLRSFVKQGERGLGIAYVLKERSIWIAHAILDTLRKLTEAEKVLSEMAEEGRGIKQQMPRKEEPQDVKDIQMRLFGMRKDDLVAVRGQNRWPSIEKPDICFGEEWVIREPVPPYDYEGLSRFAAEFTDLLSVTAKDDNTKIPWKGSVLLIGGTRINPLMKRVWEQEESKNFPFQFVDQVMISESHRPDAPREFTRVYTDPYGKRYKKTSKTGWYVVDINDPHRRPIGPLVTREGKITRDVIVLTVLRNILPEVPDTVKRLILVNAAYGAGQRLSDVLSNGQVLQDIYKEMVGRHRDPQFQAVFVTPVEHLEHTEFYREPELRSVKPLSF